MHDNTDYVVAPDIERARSLPGAFYLDPAVWAAQRKHLFAESWHVLLEDVGAGEVVPTDLLPGALDEPLLLLNDDGVTRCFSNVCTHRGAILVEERKHLPPSGSLRCRYHGRRFDRGGACLGAPGFGDRCPIQGDDLPELPVAKLGPRCFVSLAPHQPWESFIEPLLTRTDWLPWEKLDKLPDRNRRFRFEASWMLYVDNYLEGLHIPFVHPGLSKQIDLPSYETVLLGHGSSLQIAEAAHGEPALEPPEGQPHHGRRIAAYYFFLFPTTMVNLYPWGLSLNVVRPHGIADTEVVFESWCWDETLLDRGAGAALDEVELEDESVVLSVQRGMRARCYRRSRYADAERGVHHFHRTLCTDEE